MVKYTRADNFNTSKYIGTRSNLDGEYSKKDKGIWKRIIFKEDIPAFLKEYYDDPLKGFHSSDALYQKIRKGYLGISRRDIEQFLRNLETHQIHTQPRKMITNRPVLVKKPLDKVAIDLVILRSSDEGAIRDVILTVIDHYSRFTWCKRLPNKQAPTVFRALKAIFDSHTPRMVVSDNGPEFKNTLFKNYCKENNINLWFIKPYSPTQNAMVERFNGTIKRLIHKFKTQYNALTIQPRYLKQLVENYNNTPHSSLGKGLTPYEVFNNVDNAIEKSLEYQTKQYKKRLDILSRGVYPELKKGDYVRIHLSYFKEHRRKTQLKKYSYAKQYTYELYKVKSVSKGIDGREGTRQYTLEGIPGERFLRKDLLKIDKDKLVKELEDNEEYVVEEVLDDRIIDGVKQYLVKFVGYNVPEWIEEQDSFKDAIERFVTM